MTIIQNRITSAAGELDTGLSNPAASGAGAMRPAGTGVPAGRRVRAGAEHGGSVVELYPGAGEPNKRRLRLTGSEAGMATAEYAIATLAAVGFAGLLVFILRSDEVRGFLLNLIRTALALP